MKKLVLSLSLFASSVAFAQKNLPSEYGLEKIIVERYYISNAADQAQADQESTDAGIATGALPVGSITYRIYADLLPGYKILSMYADNSRQQTLLLSTTTSFYNNPNGSYLPSSTKNSLKNSLLALDSYFSMGGAATNTYGVLKTEDDATASLHTTVGNTAGVLLNDAHDVMGASLTDKDGLMAGTGVQSPSFVGFDLIPGINLLNVLSDGGTVSDSLLLIEGNVYSTAGAKALDTVTNKVLIAQLTTNGKLTFHLNMFIQKGTSPGQNYVWSNPQPAGANAFDDILLSSLNSDSILTDIPNYTAKAYNDALFSVYPNPADASVTVELTTDEANSKGSYTIYGVIGNVIAHKELNAITGKYKETIDLSSFAKGLYTIQMNVNGVVSTKKIIKN